MKLSKDYKNLQIKQNKASSVSKKQYIKFLFFNSRKKYLMLNTGFQL